MDFVCLFVSCNVLFGLFLLQSGFVFLFLVAKCFFFLVFVFVLCFVFFCFFLCFFFVDKDHSEAEP